MVRKTRKTRNARKLVVGSVVRCKISAPSRKSHCRRKTALKEDALYVVLARMEKGEDKNGKNKNTVLVAEVTSSGIAQLKYPYFWRSERFVKNSSKNYFKASDKTEFCKDVLGLSEDSDYDTEEYYD
jgi:hypothetical protein